MIHASLKGLEPKVAVLMFLKEWNDWAEAGAEGPEFDVSSGLCMSMTNWSRKLPYDECMEDLAWEGDNVLEIELRKMLTGVNPLNKPYLDNSLPFNEDYHSFFREVKEKSIHLNQHRRTWVKQTLNSKGINL